MIGIQQGAVLNGYGEFGAVITVVNCNHFHLGFKVNIEHIAVAPCTADNCKAIFYSGGGEHFTIYGDLITLAPLGNF